MTHEAAEGLVIMHSDVLGPVQLISATSFIANYFRCAVFLPMKSKYEVLESFDPFPPYVAKPPALLSDGTLKFKRRGLNVRRQ